MRTPLFSFLCGAALAANPAQALVSGLNTGGMDPLVRPQDDIYLTMNGCWLKQTEIPADRSNYGAFSALEDLSRERIKAIVEETAAKAQVPGSDAQKVGDLYKSIMDLDKIESVGMKPLQPVLAGIEGLSSVEALGTYFAQATSLGMRTPLSIDVGQDSKDATHYLVSVSQSGLGMPDRDYYLKNDVKYVQARAAYVAYISRILELTGVEAKTAAENAVSILALETVLASAQRTNVELRDPEKNYNKLNVAELVQSMPGYPWVANLKTLGLGSATELNLCQPEFARTVLSLLQVAPLSVWKPYLRFSLVDTYASVLPKAVRDADFEFHSRVLAGIPEEQPRWKKAVALVGGDGAHSFGALGDALGRLYVERHFPAVAKQRMDELVGNLMKAYAESIDTLTWMSPETKQKAREKLSKYTVKIGYTKDWRDYSGLVVHPDDAFGNLVASKRLEVGREYSRLGKPVNREEWGMTPQTVNAYYRQGLNEIVFPAAILQPPFFNAEADDAVNYGGIGAVIGHEISHGFDDKGSQYDGDGNLRNWWGEQDRKAFDALAQRLIKQYDACEPLPGKHVNGAFTIGENIADLSGVAIAFKAYHLSLRGMATPDIEGRSPEERFFFGWSQIWRRKYREAEMVKRLVTDPHSPSQYRATIPLKNMDAFIRTFGVKPGDGLWLPEGERIKIW